MDFVLSFDDIERKNAIKREMRKEVLTKLLGIACKKIRLAYSLGRVETMIQLPEIMFGFPAYNMSFVTVYINKQLLNLGYTTSIMAPGMIHVSWMVQRVKNIKIKDDSTGTERINDSLTKLKNTANQLRKKYSK